MQHVASHNSKHRSAGKVEANASAKEAVTTDKNHSLAQQQVAAVSSARKTATWQRTAPTSTAPAPRAFRQQGKSNATHHTLEPNKCIPRNERAFAGKNSRARNEKCTALFLF